MRRVALLITCAAGFIQTAVAQGTCDGLDAVGTRRCLEGALAANTEAMNALVRTIRERLPAERRALFESSHQTWIASLTADLGFLVTAFPGEDSATTRVALNNAFMATRVNLLRSVVNELGAAPTAPAASGGSAESAWIAAMRADLRNLITSEESFFADSIKYTRSISARQYQASAGVTVTVLEATNTGWSAAASHARLPGWTCRIFVGDVRPPVAGMRDAEPSCSR